MDAAIEEHLGRSISPELKAEFDQLYVEAFERDLAPIPGIAQALADLDHLTCVASSSTPDSLRRKLAHVGLYDTFADRIFSAVEVANGKPAPDLFFTLPSGWGRRPIDASSWRTVGTECLRPARPARVRIRQRTSCCASAGSERVG
jgi:FMN phosphatase YigB (HAD superfamily)